MPDALLDRWWKPKATNLLAVLYAVTLLTALPWQHALILLFPAIATILGIGTLGHLLNDWYDRDADAAVGKPNRLADLPRSSARVLLLVTTGVALLPWLMLPWDAVSMVLLALELALLQAYVAPPVRLKERRGWPILADAAYAYAIPAALAAHTFFLASGQPDDRAFLGSLSVWQLALGVRHFLNHLALDRQNDLTTETRTLATERGNRFIHRLIRRRVMPVELAGFIAVLLVLGRERLLLPVVFAGFFLVFSAIRIVLTGRRFFFGPYRFTQTALDRLYQQILPAVLLVFLIAVDWRFLLLLLVHAFVFSAWGASLARRALAPAVLLTLPKGYGGRTQESVRTADHHVPRVDAVVASGTPIAVVNINKFKYTETFVHGPIPKLRFRVHYLYGGELPQFDDADRNFLSWRPSVQLLARLLQMLLRLEPDYFLRNSVARYLQAKHVQLILGHFGPVGVQMVPIARDLGIPLIVWFHGYDVFNRETLRLCGPEYPALFREADRILAVSDVMVKRLKELNAPADKLVHLPAFVDLELFPPADHSRVGPRFLAVGRFAEMKSPHLTVLAFHRVVRLVPDAILTMVGRGGGGELFEACLILIQALGLEKNVELKGVLSHAQVAVEMQQARVFLQHSVTTPEQRDMEGKPVAIMEAMATGLPVISTRHSGIVELIEDGITGFLVDELDVDGMAETMLLLIRNDDAVRQVGQNASRRIHGDPLIRDHVAILEGIIGESIARNERRPSAADPGRADAETALASNGPSPARLLRRRRVL